MAPFSLAYPFINLGCFILVWQIAGLYYALTLFGLWVLLIFMQLCSSRAVKTLKGQESVRNDERIKLVNDMVTGVRTIKAYGWEKHYFDKVCKQR